MLANKCDDVTNAVGVGSLYMIRFDRGRSPRDDCLGPYRFSLFYEKNFIPKISPLFFCYM
jgi:hypothetical protein